MVLTARNGQIDELKSGACITLRNAKIDMFQGFMRLAVDKWGSIKPADAGVDVHVNEENNLSQVEYELVSVTNRM